LFNAYLFGPTGKTVDPPRRLWKEGDLLIHFAGVYHGSMIHTMMNYVRDAPTIDRGYLETLRKGE
jgi:hypothetical protein